MASCQNFVCFQTLMYYVRGPVLSKAKEEKNKKKHMSMFLSGGCNVK